MGLDRKTVNAVIGRVLKGVQTENGTTQQKVADAVATDVATINRYFGGKREVSAAAFVLICEACGEDPRVVMNRIMLKLKSMSAVPDNVTPLKRPGDMTDDEIDEITRKAGINDPELEQDESDPA